MIAMKLLYALAACTLSSFQIHAQSEKEIIKITDPPVATHNSSSRSITSLEYSLNAVLWQQHSGEYKALCYQAFSLAKTKLTEKISAHAKDELPLAIITDIDESILDNSPQQAGDILHHTTYTEKKW